MCMDTTFSDGVSELPLSSAKLSRSRCKRRFVPEHDPTRCLGNKCLLRLQTLFLVGIIDAASIFRRRKLNIECMNFGAEI